MLEASEAPKENQRGGAGHLRGKDGDHRVGHRNAKAAAAEGGDESKPQRPKKHDGFERKSAAGFVCLRFIYYLFLTDGDPTY